MLPAARHSMFVILPVGIGLLTLGGDSGGSDLAAEVRRAFEASDYPKAEAAARRHLAAVEAATGSESPQTAEALDLLVRCLPYGPEARSRESLALARRALELKQELYGRADRRTALSIAWRAALLDVAGTPQEARQHYDLALQIMEGCAGPDDTQTALILNESAGSRAMFGDYSGAIAEAGRALQILESEARLDSVLIASVLNRLSISLYLTGDYTAALDGFERAIAIRQNLYRDADHPAVLSLVNNRADILQNMGNHRAALDLFVHVWSILRRSLADQDDPRIAIAEFNVATSRLQNGDPGSARVLFEHALGVLAPRLGVENDVVLACLTGLGQANAELGDDAAALACYDSAYAACSLLGTLRLSARTSRLLAAFHFERFRLDTAREYCTQALALEMEIGADRPEAAATLALLGAIHLGLGDEQVALDTSLRAESIAAEHLRLMARGFVEWEALLYAERRPRGLDVPLRLVAESADPTTTAQVWDVAIKSRGVVLDVMSARARVASLSTDAETARLIERLRTASARLMNLTLRGPRSNPQAHARLLAAARIERDSLEKQLATRSTDFRRDLWREQIGLEEVERSLPPGSALVSFLEYCDREGSFFPEAEGTAWRPRWARGTPKLLAFVLAGGGKVAAVPLGPTNAIDTLVERWSGELRKGARPGSEATYFTAGDALRKAVWDPLEPHLGDARHVFVVPEGSLHRLTFAALPVAPGRYLLGSGRRFHYLAAERDLVPDAHPIPLGEGLLALGDVTFDPRAAASSTRSLLPCSDPRALSFAPLPHTGEEIRRIAALWATAADDGTHIDLLTGADATETAFKNAAAGKRVLHFAAHGFVFGLEDCPEASPGARSIVAAAPVAAPALPPSQRWLSGLIFADVAAENASVAVESDGVLTAQESALLDLHGVEWVVLSACDTGLGRTQTGEGVLGLRRAFHVAGARTLIMSLWAVSDQATAAWMASLYEARLLRRRTTIDAVHEASLETLETRRQRGESTHPFYWGAFVAAGDWR